MVFAIIDPAGGAPLAAIYMFAMPPFMALVLTIATVIAMLGKSKIAAQSNDAEHGDNGGNKFHHDLLWRLVQAPNFRV